MGAKDLSEPLYSALIFLVLKSVAQGTELYEVQKHLLLAVKLYFEVHQITIKMNPYAIVLSVSLMYIYYFYNIKVKVTLVQTLSLCTGRTAHRGSRGMARPLHDPGTRRG